MKTLLADLGRSALAFVCVGTLLMAPWMQSAALAQNGGKELIAVLPIQAVGASDVQASALTDRLQEELLRTGKYTLVDRAQMESILNEQALQQTGCTDQECAVQVGQILGVRKIVAGKATKIADNLWLLSGSITDVETAETVRAESVQHAGDFGGLLSTGAGVLAFKLAGMEPPADLRVAQQPNVPPAEGGGMPWWSWALIGVVLVGAAAGGGGDTGATCPSTSGCGSVSVTW